ncbi:MAG: OpgC protein, partial [uncultured Microvirga sp.]
ARTERDRFLARLCAGDDLHQPRPGQCFRALHLFARLDLGRGGTVRLPRRLVDRARDPRPRRGRTGRAGRASPG